MSLKKITLKPGVNRDQTNTSGEGGWYECDKIRFRSGFPEKLGGWVNVYAQAVQGVCRQMFNYVTAYSDNLVFLGTNKKVYIDYGGFLYDATPLRSAYTPPASNNCFTTTTAGSKVVLVTLTNHGAQNGNFVEFYGILSDVDGIPGASLTGSFEVANVTTNTFTITVDTGCTVGGVTGGGNLIIAAFDIYPGPAITTLLVGWGTRTWGTGVWGAAISGGQDAVSLQRDWWFSNFNDDVVMNYRKGPIYFWTYANNFATNRATLMSANPNANFIPPTVMQSMVDTTTQVLIAFGCNLLTADANPANPPVTGDYDPLLIRWADPEDIYNWDVTSYTKDNPLSGQYRLNGGSQIVRAYQTRQEILIWTQSGLFSMQATGTAEVYGFQPLATEVSVMGCRAMTAVNDVVYWMGKDRFYMYSGRVETIPCTIRNHVFKDINFDQFDQVICGTNEGYNEVWWFYPTKDSLTNNAYVIYNYLEKIWYYGYLPRTAWLDTPLRDYPMAAEPATQKVYYHENSCDDNGVAFTAYINSSDIDLDDGQKLVITKRIIPDLSFTGSTAANPSAYMTIKPRNFPGAVYASEPYLPIVGNGTVLVEQFTDQVFIRARARQISFSIGSDSLGVAWQLGTPRIDSKEDGRR
jgi:hypothetical protein